MVDVNLLLPSVLAQENKQQPHRWGIIILVVMVILFFQFGWKADQKVKPTKVISHAAARVKNNSHHPTKRKLNSEQSALAVFSIREIKMVGYIKKKEKLYGVVALPSKELMDVSLGEVIGSERAVITQLTPEKMLAKKGQRIFSIFSKDS